MYVLREQRTDRRYAGVIKEGKLKSDDVYAWTREKVEENRRVHILETQE